MPNNADRCHSLAGGLGPLWKRHRRRLPPSVRSAFAELLLEIRLFVMPSSSLDAASVIGNARFDIRGVTELLAHVAGAQDNGGETCDLAADVLVLREKVDHMHHYLSQVPCYAGLFTQPFLSSAPAVDPVATDQADSGPRLAGQNPAYSSRRPL